MTPRIEHLRRECPEGEIPAPLGAIPLTLLAIAERRPRGADRTGLCVQITLCVVVAILLFSVIALPKLRSGRTKIGTTPDIPPAASAR